MTERPILLLDMDGVLVESLEAWYSVIAGVVTEYGFTPPTLEAYSVVFGQAPAADAAAFFDNTVDGKTLDQLYRERIPQHHDRVTVAEDIHQILETLRSQGIARACITNSPGEVARGMLAHTRILELLDFVIGSDEVPNGKPAPDLVEAALARLGHTKTAVDPERKQVVFVGDSTYDLRAGRAAGVTTVGLRLDGADHRIETLRALPDLLARLWGA